MAIFYLDVKTISRGRGQSAVASACYTSGGRITDRRRGLRYDYRKRRAGIEYTSLTGWAGTRGELWNTAEGREKHPRAVVARRIDVAIPHELNADQRRELVDRFAEYLVATYQVAVDAAIHLPHSKREGEASSNNVHAHYQFTSRRIRENRELAEKTRELDSHISGPGADEIRRIRQSWADLANEALEQAGQQARIDSRTLAAQGIDREPVSYSRAALEIEARGGTSDEAENMRARQARNALTLKKQKAGRPIPLPTIDAFMASSHDEKVQFQEAPAPSRPAENQTISHDREAMRKETRTRYRASRDVRPTLPQEAENSLALPPDPVRSANPAQRPTVPKPRNVRR